MSHALRGIPRVSEALHIPLDIAVTALSVHDGNADAGIDQNPFEIGRAACGMIVAQILRGGTAGERIFPRAVGGGRLGGRPGASRAGQESDGFRSQERDVADDALTGSAVRAKNSSACLCRRREPGAR